MIVDIERYIHEGIADQGATEFMRALSKVCMDISDGTGNSTTEEKRVKQVWLTVSARMAAMSEFVSRAGMGSPFDNTMLEHRKIGGELIGMVKAQPAYGPGSITDAASYDQSNFPEWADEAYRRGMQNMSDEAYRRGMQKVRDMWRGKEIQAAARFAAFLDAHPGHPAEAFKTYIEQLGKPLTPEEIEAFNAEYHKEE